jgi:hypothetical protein
MNDQLFRTICAIGGILIMIIGFLIKSKIAEMETKIKEISEENQKIKGNYLTRFEGVNNNIHSVKDVILERLHQMELMYRGQK